MKKWQSVSEIVRAYVDKDKPNHGLLALAIILSAPIALLILSALLLR